MSSVQTRINDVKEQAITDLKEGYTPTFVAKKYNLARSTVSGWKNKLVDAVQKKISEMEISDVLGALQPISVGTTRLNDMTRSDLSTDFTVVLGDMHFGSECNKTLEVFYRVIDDLKPGKIVLNGDTVDMLAVSRYPKDARHLCSLLEERTRYAKFLGTVYEILGDGVEVVETNANHSGDGVEGRWWRYLSERLGEITCLPEIQDALSYRKVFIPTGYPFNSIKLEDYAVLSDNLVAMHGDVVRKHGGLSARAYLDKWYTSIIMNHTHRIGMTAQRIPAINGRPDSQLTVYENGCACDLNPTYAAAPNWQNGFGIVSTYCGAHSVEQLLVNDGVAVCATTGTYYNVNK